jgi:hypothetical protein
MIPIFDFVSKILSLLLLTKIILTLAILIEAMPCQNANLYPSIAETGFENNVCLGFGAQRVRYALSAFDGSDWIAPIQCLWKPHGCCHGLKEEGEQAADWVLARYARMFVLHVVDAYFVGVVRLVFYIGSESWRILEVGF